MDKIKVRLSSPVRGRDYLKGFTMTEKEDALYIFPKYGVNGLKVNDIMTFERSIYGDGGINKKVLSESVVILEVNEEDGYVVTTKLVPVMLHVDKIIKNGEDESIVWFKEDHNAFYQDLSLKMGNKIKFHHINGKIYTYNFEVPFLHKNYEYNDEGEDKVIGQNSPCVDEDFLTEVEKKRIYGYDQNVKTKYEYSFLPDNVGNNGVIIKNFDLSEDDIIYAEMRFNPFYFYTEYEYKKTDETPDDYYAYFDVPEQRYVGPNSKDYIKVGGNSDEGKNGFYKKEKTDTKHCFLYESDILWLHFNRMNDIDEYFNYGAGKNNSVLYAENFYWNVNIPLYGESVNTDFGANTKPTLDSIENQVLESVPFIDMERVKLAPSTSENEFLPATGISLYFHFRKRERVFERNIGYTKYEDGWGIPGTQTEGDNSEDITEVDTWWNGYTNNWENNKLNIVKFTEHFFPTGGTHNYGRDSDLLGYLDFTDNDVYYRKKKITQTFVRLLFYNSNDPIKAKLVYYSTIFLDATELFSKYVRLTTNGNVRTMSRADSNYGALDLGDGLNEDRYAVFCIGDPKRRLDTQINITNEYDRMHSAEGFNLYMFKDDIELYEGKPLYMKIEFNHAGNGKTIPMVIWPKIKNENGSNYVPLTSENFFDSMFIRVTVKKSIDGDGKAYYWYHIDNAENDNETKKVDLILFEPKLNGEIDEDFANINGQ